ncbi:hypothetical protein PGT21_005465 [Puccinia graminis f. sp. tritici]|uniref:Uncharacterized protein n=1 Tax=Puccinia graminis f. sp. tritici TaxID=56615 RepID=A0A5B0MJY0_PUCGR|nr:hypothetical protein PGT21_005465 [Puccinia graminis f. sp. tritici]
MASGLFNHWKNILLELENELNLVNNHSIPSSTSASPATTYTGASETYSQTANKFDSTHNEVDKEHSKSDLTLATHDGLIEGINHNMPSNNFHQGEHILIMPEWIEMNQL